MGYPQKFATSALRLANNSLDQAAGLVQKMAARAAELAKDDQKTQISNNSSSASRPTSLSYAAVGQDVLDTKQKSARNPGVSFSSDTLLSDTVTPIYSSHNGDEGREVTTSTFIRLLSIDRNFLCRLFLYLFEFSRGH